ncbi:MAG: hypothetical protein RRB13_10735 [bacterium]|nr:hypothetical protein [bacterium]
MHQDQTTNVLAQNRTAQVPIETAQGTIDFEFCYSRNQVAQLVMDLSEESDRFSISRRWLLAGVRADQKETLVQLLNDPANFTLEVAIMGALTPFLASNQVVIGTPTVR